MNRFLAFILFSYAQILIAEEILIPNLKAIYLSSSEEGLSAIDPDSLGIQLSHLEPLQSEQSFRNCLAPYLGKAITEDDLVELRREVATLSRKQHYPLTTTVIPEQDVTDGILRVILTQSCLDRVNVCGNRYFSDQRFEKSISIQPGDPISEDTLLNNLNFINRNPFHHADLVYSKGTLPDTTNLDLLVTDRFPVTVFAGADNTGLRRIEETRIFGGVTWGNVFGCDQILTVQYSTAPDIHKFYSITASYIVPVWYQHIIHLFGSYSQVHAKVPMTKKMGGFSSQGSLRYTVPLPATTHVLQEGFAGFDFKRYNNTILFVEEFPRIGQNVNITQFLTGYNLSFESGSHKLGFDTQLIFSPFEWITSQSNDDFQSLNPHAMHTYVYGRASFHYKASLSSHWYWTVHASGQLSNTTLLPSEQFGLGGAATVRGYEESQLTGDDGVLLKTEFIFTTTNGSRKYNILNRFELVAFLDYGFAHEHHASLQEAKNAYLLSAGPGIRCNFDHYVFARLDWGIKLHRDHYAGGASMVHCSVVASY